jgi:iron complex transport system ATP-binding protein
VTDAAERGAGVELRGVLVPGRERPRLGGVDLTLGAGELTVLVGPNGSGKSTLIGVALGLVRPSAGQVRWAGRPIAELTPRERAEKLAWLPQRPRLEEGLSAIEVVAAARYRFEEPRWEAEAAARRALAQVGAEAWAEATIERLSGGEAQRVRLAAMVAQQAEMWLLDEPGAHLDPAVRLELVEVIVGRSGGAVVVSHDLTVLARLSARGARVVGLREGRVCLDLPGADAGLTEGLGALLGLDLRELAVDGERAWVVAGRR